MLLDLSTPGVTVRPIRDISGHEELCEVFFENVRIPRFNLVGELNQGWEIAKSLLGFERIHIGSPKLPEHGLRMLMSVAQESGAIDDPSLRDRIVEAHLDVANLTDAYTHFADVVARGEPLGHDVSLLKIWATETFMRIGDLTIEAAGPGGGTAGHALTPYYKALPAIIYAGTNEIQRNINSRHVLNLPNE
jgi:alkylation response protein AidB-like acyl-CoA dehydrogenase